MVNRGGIAVDRGVAFPAHLMARAPGLNPVGIKVGPANADLSALLPKHAEGLFRATTRQALINEIRLIIEEVDFDTFFLGAYSGSEDGVGSASFISHADPGWTEKYANGGMIDYDPRIEHCMDRSYPLIWDRAKFQDRRAYSQATIDMFEEAASYGIKAGIAVPIISHEGLLGVMGVSSSVNTSVASLVVPTIRGRIAILREYLSEILETKGGDRVLNEMQTNGLNGRPLSPREKEVIALAALGLSKQQIADRIRRSYSTVCAFQASAKAKLGSTTIAGAVARAIIGKVIEMPDGLRGRISSGPS